MTIDRPSELSLGGLISQACKATADAAWAFEREESERQAAAFPALVSALFSAVRRMDLAASDEARERLGADFPRALAQTISSPDGAEDLFSAWWRGSKDSLHPSADPQRVVDMALWLDQAGARMFSSADPSVGLHELAQGGSPRREIRKAAIRNWTYQRETGNLDSASMPALLAVSRRWLADPSELSRCPPQDWIDAALMEPSGPPRSHAYLNFIAPLWPSFGFDPANEHFRAVAHGWSDLSAAGSSVMAVARLLKLGEAPLDSDSVNRMALSAIRVDGVRALQELSGRSLAFPLALPVSAQDDAFFSLFRPQSSWESDAHGESPLRAPVEGRAPEPCPLLIMAAWRSADAPRHAPAQLSHCFEALRQVPDMVAAATAGPVRPERLIPIDHELWPRVHAQFPQWFEPDEAGDNVMHLLARSTCLRSDAGELRQWPSIAEGPVQTLATSPNPALLSLLGQPNHSGLTPLDELRSRAAQSRSLLKNPAHARLLLGLEALSEALELRRSTATHSLHSHPSARL